MSLQESYEIYLKVESLNGIHKVCKSEMPNESIGLLVGSKSVWGGRQYTFVEGFLAGQAKATRISVEFEKGALGPLIAELRRSYPSSMIVGWYHSHPGYGCFLSATDLETQRSYFREPYHVAIVVDPAKDTFDIFKLEGVGGSYRPCSFAVLQGASEHVVR